MFKAFVVLVIKIDNSFNISFLYVAHDLGDILLLHLFFMVKVVSFWLFLTMLYYLEVLQKLPSHKD